MGHPLKEYCKLNLLPFLGLGISVQAPINLIGGLLMLWATGSGLDLKSVGIFAAVTLPYSLKFLWAPLIDRLNLPWASVMGRKRAWCFLFQLGVLGGLFFISFLDPKINTMPLFFGCLFIAICAASQELTVDSLRIDVLKGDDLTNGTVLKEFGTRLGYFAATAGMIALSSVLSWQTVYQISCALVLIGMVSLMMISEKPSQSTPVNFETMIYAPFRDLMKRQNLALLCLFIVLYKLCNGMLGKMAYPFYYDIGFTKNQIALVSATFGSIITTLGIFMGGFVLNKFKFRPLLLTLGMIEILTSLAFAWLAVLGPNLLAFMCVIIFDNIIGGIGSAVWVVFLSKMCSRNFSATQYGFLNALTMVPLTLIGTASGWLAQTLGWVDFFMLTGLMMVPALCLLSFHKKFFTV